MPKYHIEYETYNTWGVDINADSKDEAIKKFARGEHSDPYRMYDEDSHGIASCELVEDDE